MQFQKGNKLGKKFVKGMAPTKGHTGRTLSIEHRKKLSKSRRYVPRPTVAGKLNPAWKGGVTEVNQSIRMSREYKLWRTAVFERDNYTCIWCGKEGGVQADHIKPFAYFPELRFAIDNGRTLCVACHKTTDTYAGRANKIYKK